MATKGTISAGYEDFGATDNLFLITGSLVFTGCLLFVIYKIEKTRRDFLI